MIQNHALQDRQRLVLDNLDKKPIIILIDTGSSIGLLDEQLYYSLSSVPPLQPIPFSVSEEDDRPLIALGKTFISIATNDDTFRVQLIVTRNIPFTVVLGIGFLKTHGGVISFSTNQLYLTNPSPKPNESPISTNNPYTPPMHTPNTYHPHSRTCVQPNQPCHIINIGPVTIPPRTNTIMTIPCALPRSISVHYTPVIINAKNHNLPVHLINHSDEEVALPMQLCWSHGKSPRIRPRYVPRRHFPRRSSITDITSTSLVKHYIDTDNAKPIKQRVYRTSRHHRKLIEKLVKEMLQNCIIEPSVNLWASHVVLARKADKTLHLIDYRNLNKANKRQLPFTPHSSYFGHTIW